MLKHFAPWCCAHENLPSKIHHNSGAVETFCFVLMTNKRGGLKGFLRAKISMTNTRVLSECIGHLVNDYRNKRKKIIQFHIRKQPRSKERLKREKGIGCIIKSVGEKRRKSQIDLASSETYKTTTEEITQKNNMKQVRDEAHTKVQARKDIIPDKYHERKENQNKDDALWERMTSICKQDSKEVVNG